MVHLPGVPGYVLIDTLDTIIDDLAQASVQKKKTNNPFSLFLGEWL